MLAQSENPKPDSPDTYSYIHNHQVEPLKKPIFSSETNSVGKRQFPTHSSRLSLVKTQLDVISAPF